MTWHYIHHTHSFLKLSMLFLCLLIYNNDKIVLAWINCLLWSSTNLNPNYQENRSFSTYACSSEKPTYPILPYTYPNTCAYVAVRHVSFSETIAYLLNEWSQTRNCYRFYINSNFVDAEIVKFENFQIWVFQSSKIDLLELVFYKTFSYLATFDVM